MLGYIAFLDPPKETAAPAIATLKNRGVQVKILTGDNDIVSRKICRDVGLPVERIVLGQEIEKLSPDELSELAEAATVFAKVSPSQKAAIINALQRKGHVVGFMGDGINDGPALKAADVGISVDSAVDIAKETADIILLEKSLAVLGDGVLEGRKVFGNITKYIKMGASSGFGNMFSVIGASIFLPFLPMAPIQVLTNNLLYDFSQTTIPTDNVDDEYLAARDGGTSAIYLKFVLLDWADQLDLRLRHVLRDALRVPCLGQACACSRPVGSWRACSLRRSSSTSSVRPRCRSSKAGRVHAVIATSVIIAAVGIILPFTWLGGTFGLCPAAANLLDPA